MVIGSVQKKNHSDQIAVIPPYFHAYAQLPTFADSVMIMISGNIFTFINNQLRLRTMLLIDKHGFNMSLIIYCISDTVAILI